MAICSGAAGEGAAERVFEVDVPRERSRQKKVGLGDCVPLGLHMHEVVNGLRMSKEAMEKWHSGETSSASSVGKRARVLTRRVSEGAAASSVVRDLTHDMEAVEMEE